jgi:CRP/FNR family transcriptional regulator/CRP/FNR family cyclic AMP-dependent transcriptional regulator
MNVQAVLPSKVLILRRQAFLPFLRETPDFSRVLLEHLAGKLRECVDRLGVVTSQGAASRTAQALLSLASSAGHGGGSTVATLPVSQVELARTLGVAPENLSRALARLLREGLIVRAGRRRFHIPSMDRLRNFAEDR